MKKILIICLVLAAPLALSAQSETTNSLQKRVEEESFSLFFYKNTLRMLNQSDNKEFDDIIKNIEKMKFLVVDKAKSDFNNSEFKRLVSDYKAEQYEAAITSRFEGRTFDIYLKDKKGSPLGTVVLVNDSTNLYVLDILGTFDIRNASKLFQTIDGSTEIGSKIKGFMNKGEKQK